MTPAAGETNVTFTGLLTGLDYKFKIAASNIVGEGPPSDFTAATRVQFSPQPVTGLVMTVVDAETIEVTWVGPADSGGLNISYDVIKTLQTLETPSNVAHPDGQFANYTTDTAVDVSTTFDGLTSGLTYEVSVVVRNTEGVSTAVTSSITLFYRPNAPVINTLTVSP